MTPDPAVREIVPLPSPPRATVRVPGSKSITNRALILAALSSGDCALRGALRSEDTEVMIEALRRLGRTVETDWHNDAVRLRRPNGANRIPAAEADLFVANSGTSMRFLTALVSTGRGRYRLDGGPRMRERPIDDLLSSLRQLGVRASSERNNGCPPVLVETTGLPGGRVRIKGDVSSQFLSGLLMAATRARDGVMVTVDSPLVSRPYVAMTVAMMHCFGARIDATGDQEFHIPGKQDFELDSFVVEPDATAASYWYGAAAITQGRVVVAGMLDQSWQGDVAFVKVLEAMGCQVVRDEQGLAVQGRPLQGVDVDMNAISDCVMTLAAVACFADGPTCIRNVGHIRHKETDRLHALATELRRVGAEVEELADGLKIVPRPLHGASIATYNDHRMAMSMALIGLRVPGIILQDPGCVAKTYPGFFDDLEKLRC